MGPELHNFQIIAKQHPRKQPSFTQSSVSWCISTKVNFVLLLMLLKSIFRYSTMTSIALSTGTDGYKLTTSYDFSWIYLPCLFFVDKFNRVFNFILAFVQCGLNYFSQIFKNSIGLCSNCCCNKLPCVMLRFLMQHFLMLHYFDIAQFDVALFNV